MDSPPIAVSLSLSLTHFHFHCSALTDMESLVQKASNLISSFPVDSSVVYHKDIESPALQQFYRCSLSPSLPLCLSSLALYCCATPLLPLPT